MSLPEFTVVSKESSVWSASSHDFKILMISGHVSASYIFNKYKRKQCLVSKKSSVWSASSKLCCLEI
jgi:hypothetical protein